MRSQCGDIRQSERRANDIRLDLRKRAANRIDCKRQSTACTKNNANQIKATPHLRREGDGDTNKAARNPKRLEQGRRAPVKNGRDGDEKDWP